MPTSTSKSPARRHRRGGRHGTRPYGWLVTSAALILAISFIALSTNPDALVQVIGSALAFGILVDAVIIRTLLVPPPYR